MNENHEREARRALLELIQGELEATNAVSREIAQEEAPPVITLPIEKRYLNRSEIIEMIALAVCPDPAGLKRPPSYADSLNPTEGECRLMHAYLTSQEGRIWLDLGHARGEAHRKLDVLVTEAIQRGEIHLINPKTKLPGYDLFDGLVTRSDFICFVNALKSGIEVKEGGTPTAALTPAPKQNKSEGAPAIEKPPEGEPSKSVSNDESPPTQWMLQVQAEAARMFKAWRALGSKPTKNAIKSELAKWCKENNIKTSSHIYPDAEYIYRHALRKWSPPD